MPRTGRTIHNDETTLFPYSEAHTATFFLKTLRRRRSSFAHMVGAGGGRGYGRAERLEDTPMRLAVTAERAEWGKGYR